MPSLPTNLPNHPTSLPNLPSSLPGSNIKLVSKPNPTNQIKLDSSRLQGVRTYILPKENKCAISQKNESYSGHSTRPPASLDPGPGTQSQPGHVTPPIQSQTVHVINGNQSQAGHVVNGNQSGEEVPTIPHPSQPRPIGRDQPISSFSHWSKQQSSQPINKKIKQQGRSRKFK